MEAGKILFDTNPMSMVCSIVCSHDRSDQSGKGRQLYAGVKCNHFSDTYSFVWSGKGEGTTQASQNMI